MIVLSRHPFDSAIQHRSRIKSWTHVKQAVRQLIIMLFWHLKKFKIWLEIGELISLLVISSSYLHYFHRWLQCVEPRLSCCIHALVGKSSCVQLGRWTVSHSCAILLVNQTRRRNDKQTRRGCSLTCWRSVQSSDLQKRRPLIKLFLSETDCVWLVSSGNRVVSLFSKIKFSFTWFSQSDPP